MKKDHTPCPLCGGPCKRGNKQAFKAGEACASRDEGDIGSCRKYSYLRQQSNELERPNSIGGIFCRWPQATELFAKHFDRRETLERSDPETGQLRQHVYEENQRFLRVRRDETLPVSTSAGAACSLT